MVVAELDFAGEELADAGLTDAAAAGQLGLVGARGCHDEVASTHAHDYRTRSYNDAGSITGVAPNSQRRAICRATRCRAKGPWVPPPCPGHLVATPCVVDMQYGLRAERVGGRGIGADQCAACVAGRTRRPRRLVRLG